MITTSKAPTGASGERIAATNVLIVDDVPQNLIALEAVLRSEQINVLTANSGAEALEVLRAHDVAVAILDVHMPDMNGFALAELMRGSPRTADIPIIFLTASPQNTPTAFRGYDAGAVDFLYKPIEPQVILSKVQVFVQLDRQRHLLALRAQQLEQALALNETMLAVITHDLRTPLSVVSLCGDMLDRLAGDAQVRLIGQRISRSAGRMSRMLDQLLDFTRIRSGVFQVEPQRSDLYAVAAQVVEEVRQAHPDRPMRVLAEDDCIGNFDPDRLAQVVSNLAGNAAQHAQGDEVLVFVDGSDPDWLTLRVTNRGQIDDALLPRIFEPFKGLVSANSGLGLGLYIVDQFARAHGGTATACNESGLVVVTVRIPRRGEVGSAG